MTSHKVFLLLCVCAAALTHALESNALGDGSDQEAPAIIYENSEACMATGGVCTQTHNCPEGESLGAELCGGSEGVSCCTYLPTVLKSCRARGGECVPREDCAGRHAPVLDADCGAAQACCVYT